MPGLWRGGHAAPIPKPGKSPQSLDGWRAVILCESSAQGLHKALRGPLLRCMAAVKPTARAAPSRSPWHGRRATLKRCIRIGLRAVSSISMVGPPSTQHCVKGWSAEKLGTQQHSSTPWRRLFSKSRPKSSSCLSEECLVLHWGGPQTHFSHWLRHLARVSHSGCDVSSPFR